MISILLPTRKRPQNVIRLLASIKDTVANKNDVEVVIRYDSDDDVTRQAIPQMLNMWSNITLLQMERAPNYGTLWHEAYTAARGDIFMICGDDIIFRSKNWDNIVRFGFNLNPDNILLLHGNDGIHGPHYASHPFIHRKWIETVGYLGAGKAFRGYLDIWLNEIALKLGRRLYFADIYTEHIHPTTGKCDFDEIYVEKRKIVEASGQKWNEWPVISQEEKKEQSKEYQSLLEKITIHNKRDMPNITFMIPVRIDCPERIRNLRTSIQFLNKHFNTNIIVGEDSPSPTVPPLLEGLKYDYVHMSSMNQLFHKERLVNIMTRKANTPFVAIYDTDVLLPPDQCYRAYQECIAKNVSIMAPYDGRMIDIQGQPLLKAINDLLVTHLSEKDGERMSMDLSVGGSLFFNKAVLMKAGMQNEHLMSWGPIDREIVARFQILGYHLSRVDGPLFHMNHPSTYNSRNIGHSAHDRNNAEFELICSLNKKQMELYIRTWEWAT